MTTTQTDPTRLARPSDLLRETAQNGWPHGPVALDTETSGLFPDSGARVSTVSVAWRTLGKHDGETVSLAWPFNQGIEGKVPTGTGIQDSLFGRDADHNLPPQEWVALCQWLQLVGAGGSGLAFHNALFDLTLMNAGVDREGMHGVDLTPCLAWDTQLTAGLIWPMHVDNKTGRRDHSLKGLSKTLYGEAEGDEQKVIQTYLRKNKLESGRWDLMPWDVIERYAAKDAELTIRMYYDQVAAINNGAAEWIGDADDVYQLLAEDRRVCVALARMEWRGLPYDQAESRRVAHELRARQQAIKLPFAPSSNAAKRYFFDEQGHEPPARTAKGAPSLTAEGVDVLVARGIEEAKLWRDWNKAETARKMWYNGYAEMVGPDGRLRTRFRQTGTRSGRFALPMDAQVVVNGGYRTMGSLKVGDLVFGLDGRPTQVIDIPFEGDAEIWQVVLSDGRTVECSDHHLWQVRDRNAKRSKVVTTERMADRVADGAVLHLPLQDAVRHQRRMLRIDPYLMGVLLGNGSLNPSPSLSVFEEDTDILDRIDPGKDTVSRHAEREDRCVRVGLVGGNVAEGLRRYGLMGKRAHHKFIPGRYMTAGINQRLELLRGLMDTDGHVGESNGVCRYDTASAALASDVARLVRSLGGVAHSRSIVVNGGTYYVVSVNLGVCPFYASRKARRWRKPSRSPVRVVSVSRTGRHVPMKCITVDAIDGMFLTADYVPTHNSCERVNLQAIPQDYRLSDARVLEGLPTPRAVIRAEVEKNYPGWSTWELDLAQAELRVAAARAKCALMLTLIGEGADLHGETAKELFQATPEDKGWFAYRQVAKRANFSLIFGSGAETFAGMVRKEVGWEMTKHEADRLVRQWNALYPEFHRTIDVCSEQVFLRQKRAKAVTARLQNQAVGGGGAALGLDQGPWIATWGGRRKWFYGGDDFHKAFNQNVQGALAVLASKWLLAADEVIRGYDVQYKADLDGIGGAGLLLVVHDSLVMLLPDEQADVITRDVRQAGLDVWAELFPEVPGDIDVGRFGVK